MNGLKTDKPIVQGQPAKVAEVAKMQLKESKLESSILSQREAVYLEISRVLRDDKVTFDGSSSVKPHLTDERLKKIYEGMCQGFRVKKIALKSNPNNEKKLTDAGLLKTYVVGLVNNWVRRDPRLNGRPAKKT